MHVHVYVCVEKTEVATRRLQVVTLSCSAVGGWGDSAPDHLDSNKIKFMQLLFLFTVSCEKVLIVLQIAMANGKNG